MDNSGDYISRKAANEACREAVIRYPNSFYNGIEAARDAILKLPAADVRPVVKCADCKCFQNNMRQDGYLPEGVPEWECRHWCGPCDPTDFCSYGAKMEG